MKKKPILVVGATGKVGRKIVQQLLQQDPSREVRALVRNPDKAQKLFFQNNLKGNGNLIKLIVCDLGSPDHKVLNNAVEGCDAIISVSGCLRYSKLSDFLPTRLFSDAGNEEFWCDDDRSHPYFVNFKTQSLLVDLAKKHKCSRFVRLTALSAGYSPFHPVSIILSSVLSMTSRHHFRFEQYLRNSEVPYVILRPGGLADYDRDAEKTYVRVNPCGYLPPTGRLSREDVATLAILSCQQQQHEGRLLDPESNYTLGIGINDVVKQGIKGDGFATAEECLHYARDQCDKIDKTVQDKYYGVAVGIFVYSTLIVLAIILVMILSYLCCIGSNDAKSFLRG